MPAKNLLREGRSNEEQRKLVREEGSHRDERSPQSVCHERARAAKAFGLRGAQEVAAQHVEHRVALVPPVKRRGGGNQHERRQHQMSQSVCQTGPRPGIQPGRDLPGRVQQLCIAGEPQQVVQADAGVLEEDGKHHDRNRQDDEREDRERVVGQLVLLDGAVRPGGNAEERADE